MLQNRWSQPWAGVQMGLLVLVLLFNQTLGLLHGTVHGPMNGTVTSAVMAIPPAIDTHKADSLIGRLFGGHQAESDCRLFDQASHLDAMPGVPVVVLPLVLQASVFSVLAGLAVARWHALFQARGPPSFR